MAQIIRHRKGVLESVSSATKRKAELMIITGSSGITSTNSNAMIFFGDGTDATAGNKILYGTSTPDLSGASYSTAVDGIPYYNTSENKLYILAKGGNIEVSSNTDGTNIFSSSLQVANDFTSDGRSLDLGTGNFDANSISADGSLNVSGVSRLGVISGSNMRLTGNAIIDGNITLGGNINIGDTSADTVSFGGEVASDIIPSATNTYDLGSATDKFAEVHATTIYGAISASNGIVSGSSQIVLTSVDGYSSYSTSVTNAQNAQDARLTALETETGSIDTAQGVQDGRLTALETETGSIASEQSVQDGRLTALEVFSASAELNDVELFATASDQESRLDTIEDSLGGGGSIGSRVTSLETFSASAELNDVELFATASDQEGRLDFIEAKTLVSSSAQIVTKLNNQNVDFGNGDITANSFSGDGASLTNIPLGTATTGNYVASLVAGAGITLTNNSGEGATPTIATVQDISDSASPTFDTLTITGDLNVAGTTTTTNQSTLTVSDSKIFLADGNAGDSIDAGIIFNYNSASVDNTAGIFRDATDGSITFYGAYTGSGAIGNTIDVTDGGYTLGTVKAGTFEGALDWSNIANKPDTELTVTLGGTVTGTGTVELTDLGDATLIITSSIPANTNLTLNDLIIDGNLTVTGTQTVTNNETISSDSPIQILNSSGSGNPDVGLVAKYDDGGTEKVNGFFRDATDGVWKVFDGSTQNVDESTLINTANAGYGLATFQAAALSGSLDFSYLENVPDPTITINAGGDLSGSAETTLTDLADGTLNLDLTLPTTSNLTFNSLNISSDLSVTGDISTDNLEASGDITASAGAQIGTNLTVGGNATVTGDVSADNLTVTGNLTVSGTTTTVDSTTVQIGDNIIELNGTGATNGGLLVNDPDGPLSGSLLWDGTGNYWKAGGAGEESKILVAGGMGVVSGSSQISADQTTGWADDIKVQLDANTVISSSAQVDLEFVVGDTDDVNEGSTNLYYTDTRVKTKLNADGVISGSSQVDIDTVSGFTSYSSSVDTRINDLDGNLDGNIKTKLDAETVISGSSQVVLANTDSSSFDTDSVAEGTNLYYTDARVKTKLDAETVVSGSSQITLTQTDSGSFSTDMVGEGANLYYTDARVKTKLDAETVVSGSSQVTTDASRGEILIKDTNSDDIGGSNIFSDGDDLISIGTTTANVGDLGSGNQLSLYGASTTSGIVSFDIGGTAKSFDYVSSDVRYLDTNAGVSVAIKANANSGTAWVFDTDGDLVSGGGSGTSGALWAGKAVINGDISGSNLLLTGDAKIDGDITLGGNITIGDGSADSLTINADIESDIRPNADNTYDLGATTLRYAEIHGTNIFGAIKATNGVISGSAQLLNVATDFGSGRVSGDNFGDEAGTSTFTGSFVGDGSALTGLVTDLRISGSTGNDVVSLLSDDLTFAGGTAISVAVTDNTITVNASDASTSAKGIASFDADDFSVTSGNVAIKAGGVRGSNLNADVAGTGLTYNVGNQEIDVDYGSTAGSAVEGNTTISVSGTTNEIEITGTTAQALGGGASYTIGLPDDVTIGNNLTVTTDASVGGNMTVTGNLSVLGTTTTVDSTTVQIGDNILELNVGGAQTDAGLLVTDTQAPNTASGSLLWDGTNDYWKAGALGSEKELARLNGDNDTNTVQKIDANGLLVDSTITDDGTDVSLSGDLTIVGLSAGANGGFIYTDSNNKLQVVNATNAGDVIQWDGSSFVASNGLDGGTF